ncbi:MAG: phosphoglucosamine mutase [Lentisphaerae bacterium RIFOXYB12_FULL_65_16]|nr:MAG: phosphoglucosamine mutase [Lentisphaerae bacterium RIFOXYA12_64_32]OGV94043.1 MAG: phosphoglucosamine mutase [Lentisphaerae bacterium RIFOXYB12_FULL_65_16]
MGKLFGTDGIRGQANCYPITPEVALQTGKAMAHVFQARGHGTKRAIIGKDTRLSGYMLESALTSGLVSLGMDVLLVGPVPTPAVAHLAKSMGAAVGIMLTASHNPYDDNGIKVFSHDGFKLSDEIEAQIEELVLSEEMSSEHIRSEDLGKAYRVEDARGRYIEFAKSSIANESLDGLKVVLDCANGAAYLVGPWIFKELGAEVTKIFAEPDGFNINNGCGALHPETVGEMVRQRKADVGIALDGDADRVIFCDAQGNMVDGDRILAMCALEFKTQGKLAQDTLVVTSMSNLGLHDAMRKAGVRVEVTDVGDRQVIERMRADRCNLGGEKSGHVIFMDYATTGDGILTALQVLRLMKQQGASLADLAKCMTEYPQALVSLRVVEKRPLEDMTIVQKVLERCRQDLGKDGRVLLRYSGTEPKVRLLVEARETAAVERWVGEISSVIHKEIGA